MTKGIKTPIGSILVEQGAITAEVRDQALIKQNELRDTGRTIPLGKILIAAKKISESQLAKATAAQHKQYLPELKTRSEVEETYGLLEPQYENTATKEPFVEPAYAKQALVLETTNGEPVIMVTSSFHKKFMNALMTIRNRVQKAYTAEHGRSQAVRIIKSTSDLLDLYFTSEDVGDDQPKTEFEQEFETLVRRAYEAKAVDLHFFRKADLCTVRFRVWGSLRTYAEWRPEKADKVVNVGFTSFGQGSKYPNWDQKVRQRVRIKIRYSQHITLDCRYEHAPGDEGAYHACIRILANDKRDVAKQIHLTSLGFTKTQMHDLEAAASSSSGLVLLSGPTGSGKSTTLAGLVKFINRANDTNVLTVESPIERELPAFQTSVSDDDDADPGEFARAIKSTLRRDPDCLMVGEIRDEMSASAAATGVQTGHTLLSTVHAQSGIEIVERLSSPAMKLPPETIGSPSFISALVFQKLVPTLDPDSKVRLTKENLGDYLEGAEASRMLRLFPDFDKRTLYVRGTSREFPEGVAGMTICAEVVIPDDQMRRHFRGLELMEALEYWRLQGVKMSKSVSLDERSVGMTAADHAIAKVEAGLIDPRDLETSFGYMDQLADKRNALKRINEAA